MKIKVILLLLSFPIFPSDVLTSKLETILEHYKVRQQYSESQIKEMSNLLDEASLKYQVSFYKLLSLIALESGFDRYHSYRNTNGSIDIGLMQSNSDHIKERCLKLFKRNCDYEELLDPIISIKISFYRFNECSKYSKNDAFFVCYNNEHLAYKYLTSDFYPEYLEKLYREYAIIESLIGRKNHD